MSAFVFSEKQLRCSCLMLGRTGDRRGGGEAGMSPGPGEGDQGLSPGSSGCVTLGQSPTISELLEHGMVKRAEALEADRLTSETGLGPWETLGTQNLSEPQFAPQEKGASNCCKDKR